jgi:hypothetical protein
MTNTVTNEIVYETELKSKFLSERFILNLNKYIKNNKDLNITYKIFYSRLPAKNPKLILRVYPIGYEGFDYHGIDYKLFTTEPTEIKEDLSLLVNCVKNNEERNKESKYPNTLLDNSLLKFKSILKHSIALVQLYNHLLTISEKNG